MREKESITGDVPSTARLLGWAGLLPFCLLPLVMLWQPDSTAVAGQLLSLYAFGILCFLLGIWWGIGVMRKAPLPLIYSNALFLVLLVTRVLADDRRFMPVAALLFVVLILMERSLAVFQRQPVYYATLRRRLSLVAALSLVLGAHLQG